MKVLLLLSYFVALTAHTAAEKTHAERLADWRSRLRCPDTSHALPDQLPVKVFLEGEGAHRQLRYAIGLAGLDSLAQDAPLDSVHLGQALPVEVFVDPYQLNGVTRQHSWLSFTTYGPLDLESPAPACKPTVLGIKVHLSAWRQSTADEPKDQVVFSVPVHHRYPAPVNETSASAHPAAWWAPLLTGAVAVTIPKPVVVGKGASKCLEVVPAAGILGKEDEEEEGTQLVWVVPAGSLQHAEVASLGTMLAAAVSTAVVLAVLFRDRLQAHSHDKMA